MSNSAARQCRPKLTPSRAHILTQRDPSLNLLRWASRTYAAACLLSFFPGRSAPPWLPPDLPTVLHLGLGALPCAVLFARSSAHLLTRDLMNPTLRAPSPRSSFASTSCRVTTASLFPLLFSAVTKTNLSFSLVNSAARDRDETKLCPSQSRLDFISISIKYVKFQNLPSCRDAILIQIFYYDTHTIYILFINIK